MGVVIVFPVEFLVLGTPPSHQSARRDALADWKGTVREASRSALPEGHFATDALVAVTVYYFTDGSGSGDLDNIIKPILDAMSRHIYRDDKQVARLLVQRFEPDDDIQFLKPSSLLTQAQQGDRPILYVRIDDQPLRQVAE
ncbi:RusA family crossover junction endodeoxyribonuclease [uncultured Rhodospira sp.]|uniref:RusA family crossover junction endodeoxyribonuclease n=1 Tax=uncultured Rhodospira sp. TaxID=1936189 RepID=UPI0026221BC5|nr:RusA family crossover junction endodeoxyribonuclease [uncultured Rhodospira sp.]